MNTSLILNKYQLAQAGDSVTRRSFVAAGLAAAVACARMALNPAAAFGVTAAQKQAEAAAVYDRLQGLEVKLDQASNEYFTCLSEQKAAQKGMDDAQKRIEECTDKISTLQTQLATRAKSMYRTGSTTFLDVLLGSTSFQAFSSNWDTLNQMNDQDSKMVEETKAMKTEVEDQKVEFTKQEAIAAEKTRAAEAVKAEAQQLVNEVQSTYNSLSAEAARLLAAEQEARRRQEEARARAAAARAAANNNRYGGVVDNSKKQTVTGNTVVDRGYTQYGKPYVWAAVGPSGYDCSGFVSYCLTGQHTRLGTTYTFLTWTAVTDPKPGDICVNAQHCGIYIGNGMMIHASVSRGVVEAPVWSSMVYRRY